MSFCLQCGAKAHRSVPVGDSRPRLVCPACQYIHYDNPKMVCGTLSLHQGKVLLCKRAIAPRYGHWTLPAGFMEIGETMRQGAMRETAEETCAKAHDVKLYALFDIPAIGQIHAMYLARVADGQFGVGEESLECALFDLVEIDKENLAFATVRQTIELYETDKETLLQNGQDADDFALYPLHQVCIDRDH